MGIEKTPLEIGKGLADDAEEEDAAEWVKRQRLGKKKKVVEAKAQEFDELDEAAEEEATAAGLSVYHDTSALEKGTETVLTLKDERIIDAKGRAVDIEDKLESSDLLAGEKRSHQTKAKSGFFDKYSEEAQNILPQYDEAHLEFEKGRKAFKLDAEGGLNLTKEEEMNSEHMRQMAASQGKTHYSLEGDKFTLQTVQRDTFTEQEMVQFRKPKKKKVVRKRPNTKELIKELTEELKNKEEEDEDRDHGTRAAAVVEEREQADALQKLMSRVRGQKICQEKSRAAQEEIQKIAEKSLTALKEGVVESGDAGWQTVEDEKEEETEGTLVIDPTAEFARNIETEENIFEKQRKRKLEVEQRKKEREAEEEKKKEWFETTIDDELSRQAAGMPRGMEDKIAIEKAFRERVEKTELISEPMVKNSMADALKTIHQKGLLDTVYAGRANDHVLEFDETNDPAPHIVLVRRDRFGRELTQKQAYREQSHAFHGKHSSKNKTRKAEERFQQQMRTLTMKDNDTGLGSLKGLRQAQEQTRQAGIVLQGGLMEKVNAQVLAGTTSPLSTTTSSKRGLDSVTSTVSKRSKAH